MLEQSSSRKADYVVGKLLQVVQMDETSVRQQKIILRTLNPEKATERQLLRILGDIDCFIGFTLLPDNAKAHYKIYSYKSNFNLNAELSRDEQLIYMLKGIGLLATMPEKKVTNPENRVEDFIYFYPLRTSKSLLFSIFSFPYRQRQKQIDNWLKKTIEDLESKSIRPQNIFMQTISNAYYQISEFPPKLA